jgi:BON domain
MGQRYERDAGSRGLETGRWYTGDPFYGHRHHHGRGFVDRASDEVRSWFGDDAAEARRRSDWRRDRADDESDRWAREDWDEPQAPVYRTVDEFSRVSGPSGPWEHYTGRGPRAYHRSDARIREDVCDALTDDPWVDPTDVEVRVADGEVTLIGTVESRNQKRRAEDVAARVHGATDVINEIRIRRVTSASGLSGSPLGVQM